MFAASTETVISFCRDELLNIEKFEKIFAVNIPQVNELDLSQKITAWLKSLCSEINKIKNWRNEAAHGGKIMAMAEAEMCFDELVLVQELLAKIVGVCRI